MEAWFDRFDGVVVATLRRWSIPLLRISLGLVFSWFGALKVFGVTPVADLVASTVYWVDPDWFVPLLGLVEMAIGVGLVLNRALRFVLAVFVVQMIGTLGVFVLLPAVAFQQGNPLLLTVEGEFVLKNLVLIAAGLVVGSTVLPRDPRALPTTAHPAAR
jgi:uncharacterized membrane protein YkgB